MSRYFVDCQGLAGAWSLGTAKAGFTLKHRATLPGGFGDIVMEDNRHKFKGLDGYWTGEVGTPSDGWTPQMDVSFLCGTPPCSGFSLPNFLRSRISCIHGSPPRFRPCTNYGLVPGSPAFLPAASPSAVHP